MGLDDLLISTGVDALIKLVRERGRVDIKVAASTLKLPLQTVEDWTRVLEGEGLIKIEYQLTNVILVWKAASGEEVKARGVAITHKKNDTVAKIEAIQTSVQQSQVELGALQEQMTLTNQKTHEQMERLSKDLSESNKLSEQAADLLNAKQAQIKQMQEESEGLRAELARFAQAMKEIPGRENLASSPAKVKRLADEEDRLAEKMKATEGVFEKVESDIRALNDRIDNDRTGAELAEIKKTLEDLQFSRSEMVKNAQTLTRESQMLGEEVEKVGARIKEIEGHKNGLVRPEKLLAQAEALAKTVAKQRENVLGDMSSELDAVRRQVQAYTQAQYQYQTISTRSEALRGQLSQQGHELGELSQALTAATTVYNQDLVEARDHLEEQQGKYAKLEEKAKKVEYILGHLQELKTEGDILSAKLSGIIKEANLMTSLGPVAGGSGPETAAGPKNEGRQKTDKVSGTSDDRGPSSHLSLPGSATGASSALGIGVQGAGGAGAHGIGGADNLPAELVQRIALTTAEEEEFEKKRQELGFLIRKMWDEDRNTGHGA